MRCEPMPQQHVGAPSSTQQPAILTMMSAPQWCMYTGMGRSALTEYSWPEAGEMPAHRVAPVHARCDDMKPPLLKPAAKIASGAMGSRLPLCLTTASMKPTSSYASSRAGPQQCGAFQEF